MGPTVTSLTSERTSVVWKDLYALGLVFEFMVPTEESREGRGEKSEGNLASSQQRNKGCLLHC